MKSQYQMFYEEQRKIADLNELFLELVKEGMTREELSALIEKRPQNYSRFSSWLDKLPSKSDKG